MKGAITGAKAGMVFSWVGGVVGAIVVGALYSALAAIQYRAPQFDSGTDYSKNRVELIYSNVCGSDKWDKEFESLSSDVKINFPKGFEDAMMVGIKHNAALSLYTEGEEFIKAHDPDSTNYITREIPSFFDRPEYVEMYEYLIENMSAEIDTQNLDRLDPQSSSVEEKTIRDTLKLFLHAYQSSTRSMDDVNYLVNSYIQEIDGNMYLTNKGKASLYFALSTAAYSASYWNHKANDLVPVDGED